MVDQTCLTRPASAGRPSIMADRLLWPTVYYGRPDHIVDRKGRPRHVCLLTRATSTPRESVHKKHA